MVRRGCFKISPAGAEVLANPPERIDIAFLDQFPGFAEFRKKSPSNESQTDGGDAGIDGVINEDYLGLDVVYLQAKRWENTVGRPEIQKFVGSLHGKRAKKGVFLTTSNFSAEAIEYVKTIDPRVVLIDGMKQAQLMVEFPAAARTLAVESMMQRRECGWLRQGHDRFERERVSVSVVPIRDAADRMSQNLNRRFRHVLVVVSRRSIPKIFQNPEFLFAGFHILLWLDPRQVAQQLKLLVGP